MSRLGRASLPFLCLLGFLAGAAAADTSSAAAGDASSAQADDDPSVETAPDAAEETAAPRPAEPLLPQVDFYFPEGELEFRLNGLIEGSFYEGQIRYDFVSGDILAFLRYRYYGHRRVFQLGLFDSIEFSNPESGAEEFDRVRGGHYLVQWPHSIDRRTSLLIEFDDISSTKQELRFTTDRTNSFVRLGYQLGTAEDDRSNSLVGESRGRRRNLFTAHRRIGPSGAGLTLALTWGFDFAIGDFDYVKAELEGLKRFDLGHGRFLIHRLHGGSFLDHDTIRDDPGLSPGDRLSIPRNELLALDGRDNLKGVSEPLRGTSELHTTTELFLPWFLDAKRHALGVDWQTWYWILYGGLGTTSFERRDLYRTDSYLFDLGFGFEAGFRLKGYRIFVAALVAHALADEGGLEARLSLKSYR